MSTDTLEIFGREWTGVTAIDATDNNSQTKTYIRGDNAVLFQDANGYINIPSEQIDSLAVHTKVVTNGSSKTTSLSITNIPSRPVMFFLLMTDCGTSYVSSSSSVVGTDRTVEYCIYDGIDTYGVAVGATTNVGSSNSINLFNTTLTPTHSYSGTTLTVSVSNYEAYFPKQATYTLMYVC